MHKHVFMGAQESLQNLIDVFWLLSVLPILPVLLPQALLGATNHIYIYNMYQKHAAGSHVVP